MNFPRLGAVLNGGKADYSDPACQAQIANLGVVILGDWPGATWGGGSLQSILTALKAKNPALLTFGYVNMDSLAPAGDDAYARLREHLNAVNGWLLDANKVPVPSFYSRGQNTINSSLPSLANFIANWHAAEWLNPSPALDGLFMDNVFAKPRVAGDWYNTGTVLQPSDPKAQAAIQGGYQQYFRVMRSLTSKYLIGNIGSWWTMVPQVPTGYQGMLDGGLLEALIGESYSIETFGGWAPMMRAYQGAMAATLAPHIVIFSQHGSPTDYQSFRYGFCSCAIDDGFYAFSQPLPPPATGADYSTIVWFDEYNANLGKRLGAKPTGPWINGVWRCDFANGIALINPKGNGVQTVPLEAPMRKIQGTQCPVNDGATVTSVTLQDRDGIVLLR